MSDYNDKAPETPETELDESALEDVAGGTQTGDDDGIRWLGTFICTGE